MASLLLLEDGYSGNAVVVVEYHMFEASDTDDERCVAAGSGSGKGGSGRWVVII